MKYIQAFIMAFAIGIVATVAARVALVEEAPPAMAGGSGAVSPTPAPAKPVVPDKPKPDPKPAWTGPVVDLGNDVDPTNGEPVADVTSEYLGYRVRLSSEDSKRTFEKWPIRFLMKLDLEVVKFDGAAKRPARLAKVDSASYGTIAPEICLMTAAMKIDVSREVYVLHRGFKVHL